MRIRTGKVIPRNDGKRIEELVGNATTGTSSVSVAKMRAPLGWTEPAQRPDFDEVVLVQTGTLELVVDGRSHRIGPGETGLVPRGAEVRYQNGGDTRCEYFSICAPAFHPDHAHVQPETRKRPNTVLLNLEHVDAEQVSAYVENLAHHFLAKLGLKGRELSIALVGDRAIRKLNREWRKKDKTTDVLSFPAGESPRGAPGPVPLGDIIISLDTTRRAAREYTRTFDDELARYLAHGLLHLLGHDHHSPRESKHMAREEGRLLGEAGMVGTALLDSPRRRKVSSSP